MTDPRPQVGQKIEEMTFAVAGGGAVTSNVTVFDNVFAGFPSTIHSACAVLVMVLITASDGVVAGSPVP